MTARSDWFFDSNTAVAELLPGTGSTDDEVTEVVLLIEVSQGTFGFTLTVKAKLAEPAAIVGKEQVIAPVAPTAGVTQFQLAGAVRD